MVKTPGLKKFIKLSKHCQRVPVVAELCDLDIDPALLYKGLFANQTDSFLFESGKGPKSTARYSIMGASNSISIRAQDDSAWRSNNGESEPLGAGPLSALEAINFAVTDGPIDYIAHFWGGWVGFIGYEAERWLAGLPKNKKNGSEIPDLYFAQVDRVIVYDHCQKILKYIVSRKLDGGMERDYLEICKEIDNYCKKIEFVLHEIKNNPPTSAAKPPPCNKSAPTLKSNITKSQYVAAVKKAKKYIAEGDIYQANIAQKFEIEYADDPFRLYINLRKINPSPFGGFLNFKGFCIVSSSPERLVKLKNNILETRPIAGTRPRGKNEREDNALSAELLLDAKEKAEHLMLVDLERNDIGRICQYGSVEVTDFMFLEKYSHVSHIVSNIKGTLKQGISVKEIIQATFPGGTITGCPKIRCMEIINELEPSERGPYSGSFGYIGFDRQMDLNIIIRTIIIKNNKAYFHVGAGIVADSIPESEYQETLNKAAAMINALTADA